jgi:hypothetical protein
MTSCAPRLAEMNARPVIHAGMERPDEIGSLHVPDDLIDGTDRREFL